MNELLNKINARTKTNKQNKTKTGQGFRQFRNRNHQDRPRIRLHRSRRPSFVRYRSDRRKGPPTHRTLQGTGNRQIPHPHQDCRHLGGNPGRQDIGNGGHHLQPDPHLLPGAGRCLCRGRCHAHLAVCGPHHGFLQGARTQKGSLVRGLFSLRRSRRCQRDGNLQLLQETRLQHHRHGRLLPQHRRDHGIVRVRPLDHFARTHRKTQEPEQRVQIVLQLRAKTRRHQVERDGYSQDRGRRKNVPNDELHGCHGDRKNSGRNPWICRRYRKTRSDHFRKDGRRCYKIITYRSTR
mmetsp:Transcript_12071/g.25525  ORF Transcript_12071/g.25525 Transcript_12071/m.25525 type:complete len:293 (-) Transcript_12071:370-1248(-)